MPTPVAAAPASLDASSTRPAFDRPLPAMTPAQWSVQVNRQLIDCRRQRSSLALVVLVVDTVRTVDDQGSLGEQALDALAQVVLDRAAQRLRTQLRSSDRVVLLGERCLGAMLVCAGSQLARQIGGRIATAVAGSYRVDQQLLVADIRSALAAFPEHGTSGEALLHTLGPILTPG